MKSFLAGICIFISISTFLRNEELKHENTIETSYTFQSVDNYEVLPVQNGKTMDRLFQTVSNTTEANKTNAIILVQTENEDASNGLGYFAVPIEDSENLKDLIEQYTQNQKVSQAINESPLALRD